MKMPLPLICLLLLSSVSCQDYQNDRAATPKKGTVAPATQDSNPEGNVKQEPEKIPATDTADNTDTTKQEPIVTDPMTPETGSQDTGSRNAAALKLIAYFKDISGKKTVTGQHNKEPNTDPSKWTNYIKSTTGVSPGLWSGDFLFRKSDVANRQKMIDEAIAQWKAGSIVNIMLHVCPPTQPEDCEFNGSNSVFSKLSDAQWADLMKDGGSLNKAWKARMDVYASFMQKLKDAGVAPMFRPFHEMNQVGFWWGGRQGSGGTAKLFEMTHDYMVKTKGLTNIVWVWDIQDLDWTWEKYKPRADTWDVMALDVYNGDGFTTKKYTEMKAVAAGKPIAIGECEVLPTDAELAKQPEWIFFMGWAELVQQKNSTNNIKAIYSSSKVLNQGALKDFK